MASNSDRASISATTKLRLFSDSAGYCQRPNCGRRLFSEKDEYHLAEIAHIFAATDGGPRANQEIGHQDRASYENLILLCPSCHTEIDKAPEAFPASVIIEWKSKHIETIKNAFGMAKVQTREEARSLIVPYFARNKAIFNQLNPDKPYRENPEAEEAEVWKRKMLSHIIPNNKLILLAIETNRDLLIESEFETVELFRLHIDDLIERHIGSDQTTGSRFPNAITRIFE